MTVSKLCGINGGGYRITDIVNGYYVSKLYIGYSKQVAVRQFKKDRGQYVAPRRG